MTTKPNRYLSGNFAPWNSEDSLDNLEIEGKLPSDLQGTLLRNGPNPQFMPTGDYHWFQGDGMIHAIRIHDGKASYQNRWVHTNKFELESEAGCALYEADSVPAAYQEQVKSNHPFTANTNIIQHNGNILALNEGSIPYAMDLDSLTTLGMYTYDQQIETLLSAHPRFDHQRQELMTYSYINEDGSLRYYRIDKNNRVIANQAINWPYQCMLHDFVNTENYVIFPIFPCTMSFERLMRGEPIFMWEGDQLPTVFIVTDKDGNEVTRIETNPCYAYHFANAYEVGNTILIDAMVSEKTALMPDRQGNIGQKNNVMTCYSRWEIDLGSKKMTLTAFDELDTEFPRFDERFNGLPYHTFYCGGNQSSADFFDRIVCYQAGTDNKQQFILPTGDVPGEPVFVPRSAKEGDGYLLSVVYRKQEDRSDVLVLDAQRVADGPIATIKIPHRIPYGFHGNFVTNSL
jgi:carotenoid cleavage dioxygenase